jgi:hypothetical protein
MHGKRNVHRKGEAVEIVKPAVALYYTTRMGHCDVYDKHAMRHRSMQKNYVWRRARFVSILKYFFINTWIFAAQLSGDKKPLQKKFLEQMSNQLMKERRERLKKEESQRKRKNKNKKRKQNKKRWKKKKRGRRETDGRGSQLFGHDESVGSSHSPSSSFQQLSE